MTWAVANGERYLPRRRAIAAAEREQLAAALAGTDLAFPPGVGPLSGSPRAPLGGPSSPRTSPPGGSSSPPAPPGATTATSASRCAGRRRRTGSPRR